MIVAVDDESDPEEGGGREAAVYGAILSPSGTILAVPHALGAEPPRPEPEERWTLGPVRRPEAGTVDGGPERSSLDVTLQPVQRRRTGPGNARTGPR